MAHALASNNIMRGAAELILYAAVGVVAGAAAAAMTAAASTYASALTSLTAGEAVMDFSYLNASTPPAAALAALSSLIALGLALLTPEAMGASIDELLNEYHHRATEASPRGVAVKLVATPIAVGGGVPVGILGPVVYVGGSVGGLLGKALGLRFGLRRRLFIAGIAGALSWALRAPLGAVFFALEIPYHRDLEAGADAAVAAAVGSFSSFLVSVGFSGPPLPATVSPPEHSLGYVVAVVIVGVLSGVVGRAFSRVYHLGVGVRRSSKRVAIVVVPAVTAASVLASPLLAGRGSGVIDVALAGESLPAAVALAILTLRLGTSPLLSGLGVPGGLFGPGLAVGALLGLSVSSLTGLGDPSALAIVGMASLYGAVSTTPIGMSIIAAEVSGNYFLVVPSLIAALIAREVVGGDYLYINQKDRRLRDAVALARDLAETLKRVGRLVVRADCVGEPSPTISVSGIGADEVLRAVDSVPAVVLVGGSVAGVVSEESLARYFTGLGDVVDAVPVARCGDDLFAVVDLMVRHNSAFVVLVGDGGYWVLRAGDVVQKLGVLMKKVASG